MCLYTDSVFEFVCTFSVKQNTHSVYFQFSCYPADDRKKSDDKKKDPKKKSRRPKMETVDPHLLLSCVYFDQNHTNYLIDRDVEEIIHSIGLHLSRSQVRQ